MDAALSTSPTPDRSRRLALFGAIAILVGLAACGLGTLNLLMPVIAKKLPGAPPADWATSAAGGLTWWMIGAGFIVSGAGSMRCRRWVRPVMLVLAWTWLLSGIMALALAAFALDTLLLQSAAASGATIPVEALTLAKWIAMAAIGIGGVALPAAFVWAYNDGAVLATCRARNPQPDWTEARPTPVLGLALALGATGILTLPLAFHPVIPFFGAIVTGLPGAALTVLGALACLVLARATYRQTRAGWWGTLVLLVGLGAAVAVTFLRVDAETFLVAYGFPPATDPGARDLGPAIVGATIALTLASVGYLAAVRRHFSPR